MPAPASVDDLLKLIRKSGMIDEPRLDAYLERLRLGGPIGSDVRKIAGGMVRDGLLTYFQAEQFMLGKWRGFTIGKYKLLERIGFGGMGQVFLCEHMYMRRRVAIKVLPPAKAEEPAALGRFYREARAAAALDHSNIVRTHDIDQDGNLHFLVMEYVDGSSMLEIVKKKGPMSVDRAVQYVWQAVQGLEHAYRVGVIHRDIKPGNIMIDRQGISKILDMGLAKFYQDDGDMLTKKYDEKSVLGTADYVAPEQTINSHEVDIRADIYSLGATFYFLLAGHPPFPDGTVSQKLIAHQTKRPTPIHKLRPEVPAAIGEILERMMAKGYEDRYQTPTEIYDALLPFVDASIGVPPEDEMPLLSPAAREAIAAGSHSGIPASIPGSLPGLIPGSSYGGSRFDATAPPPPPRGARSGRYAAVPTSRVPVAVAEPVRPGEVGSSGNMASPYFEPPPMVSPLGSAAIPPVPNPGRPANETARLAEATDRGRPAALRPVRRENRGMNPVVKIVIEAILVFALCLGMYFVLRSL